MYEVVYPFFMMGLIKHRGKFNFPYHFNVHDVGKWEVLLLTEMMKV